MAEMIKLSIDIHVFFVILLVLVPLRNLYVLYTKDNFIRVAKSIKFPSPFYFGVLASLAFSGLIIAMFIKQYFTFDNALMTVVTIYLLVSEIKRVKKLRPITSKEYDEQQKFIKYAKKKYTINTIVIALLTLYLYTLAPII